MRNYQEHREIILKLTYSLNDSEIKVLVDVLLQLDFIEYLFLEDTLPSNNGAILLSQLLKQKKNIKEFKLSGPRINTVGAKAIAESLIDNTNIEKFELSNTNFGDEGAIAFSEILNTTLIRKLNLNSNFINNNGIISLANILKDNITITDLDLSFNKFNFEVASNLKEVIMFNKTIMTLFLDNNNLGDPGIFILVQGLIENNTLRKLNISDNNINIKGAEAIARALLFNKSIMELDIFNNNISDEGTIALANTLESNDTITKINLSGNNISDNGAIALGNILKINKSITHLNISSNEINHIGAISLAEGLEKNNTIKNLNLNDNNISDIGFLRLAEVLSLNYSITFLSVGYNNITNFPIILTLNKSIKYFNYRGNEIQNLSFLVKRWINQLDQYSTLAINPSPIVYLQNIHNDRIQKNTHRSYIRIIEAIEKEENGVTPNVKEVIEKIRNHPNKYLDCSNSNYSLRDFLIKKAEDCTQIHTTIGLSFGEALWFVWRRIENFIWKDLKNEEQNDIIDILCNELITGNEDNTNKCFTGSITRLISALNGIDPLVNIDLQNDNDRIINIIYNIYKDFHETYEQYKEKITTSNVLSRIDIFMQEIKNEFEKEGIILTEEISRKYIEPILEDIN